MEKMGPLECTPCALHESIIDGYLEVLTAGLRFYSKALCESRKQLVWVWEVWTRYFSIKLPGDWIN